MIAFACVFLLSAALTIELLIRKTDSNIANVYQDGRCIYSVDLSLVTEGYELVIADEIGENTLRMEPGRICVIRADCPDQTCVNMGWLSHRAAPVVCLPHKLVIQLEENAADMEHFDAVAR